MVVEIRPYRAIRKIDLIQTKEQNVPLDDFDRELISTIKASKFKRPYQLYIEFPTMPPTTVFHRVMRLQRLGYLRTEKGPRILKIYAVEA